MSLDPEKVKELVLIYSKLDDDYQKVLMSKAWELSFKQSQKNQILKSGENFKTKEELEDKVKKETVNRLKEAEELIDIFKTKMNDSQKAELIALMDKLSNGKMTEKTDIEIKINHKKVRLTEYLEEMFPEVDVKEANKNATQFLKDYKKEL